MLVSTSIGVLLRRLTLTIGDAVVIRVAAAEPRASDIGKQLLEPLKSPASDGKHCDFMCFSMFLLGFPAQTKC